MTRIWKAWCALLFAAALLGAGGARAQDGLRGPLASVEWLQRHLGKTEMTLLDASFPHLYQAGHIPGAVNVDLFSYGAEDQPVAEMEKRFRAWGISPGRRVVIYDEGGSFMATRIFYDLLHHGVPAKDLLVLDGGLAKWKAAGGAVTKDPTPAPAPGTLRVTQRDESLRVRLPEFLTASGDLKNHALVEALDADSHFGGAGFFDRPGHIPHAIMWPSKDFFNEDKTFKSPDEIRRMAAYLGIRPDQTVHSHCGGGIAASVPFFALKYLAGFEKVKLFQESQLGWLRDPRQLPMWTYDAPALVRDALWVNGWGGKMLRMYGLAHVAIVDVRSPETFRQAHLPFSVNMPAERFRNADPAALAEALGQAGVNRAHEAVVVSDKGLDPTAALAFLMLERVGQARVSLFVQSIDHWAEQGYEVAKAGANTPPHKATSYTAQPRGDGVITDAQATRGLFPKVFVASGKALPAKAPAGTVVHLPYTELLDAQGRPKAAKDLWTRITKAGIPRYAEIVLIADDPGEAAANYVLFRMMGWPDVKVLMPSA